MIHNKERILIVGNSGSGKSTFGKLLSRKLNLPLIHLDKYFWKPGWEPTYNEEWNEVIRDMTAKDKWIIEGNYTRTFKMRALRSDYIYFYDYSSILCLYRIYKRVIKSKLKLEIRTDMADGCYEPWIIDSEFTKFVWNYNKVIRPRMYSILEEVNYDKNNLIIFSCRKEFKEYVKNLNKTL